MSTPLEIAFGKVCVQLKLLTAEQVKSCSQLAELRLEEGRKNTIWEIAVEKGFIPERESQRLIKGIQKKIEQAKKAKKKELIPGYEILGRLGEGAFSTVYKAHQKSLDKIVAIKVLSHELKKDEEYRNRFHREAKAAARLDHPNIIRAYDVGEANGLAYFVMEYVDGPDLHKVLKKEGGLNEEEALRIVREVARGLQHAHEHGITHRDIKPENICLTSDGRVKVADLGLAKDITVDGSLTQTGFTIGTPAFFSPEQAAGRDDLDTRSDIYSLGVTFYYLLSGDLPFTANSTIQVMKDHISKAPPIPHENISDISVETSDMIRKMLEKDRKKRHQTPKELVEEIDEILGGSPDKRDLADSGERFLRLASAVDIPSLEEPEGGFEEVTSKQLDRIFMIGAGACLAFIILLLIINSNVTPVIPTIAPGGEIRLGSGVSEEAEDAARKYMIEIARGGSLDSPVEQARSYRDVALRFPGTQASKEARESLKQLEGKIGEYRDTLVHKALSVSKKIGSEGKSYDALTALGALEPEILLQDRQQPELKKRISQLREEIRSTWWKDRRTADGLIKEGKYNEALVILKNAQLYASPEAYMEIHKRKATIQRLTSSKPKKGPWKLEDGDHKEYMESIAKVCTFIRRGQLNDALVQIRVTNKAFKTSKYKKHGEVDRAAVKELMALNEAFVSILKGAMNKRGVFFTRLGERIVGRVTTAGSKALGIKTDDGEDRVIAYTEFSLAFRASLVGVLNQWEISRMIRSWGLLLHYHEHFGIARAVYGVAQRQGGDVASYQAQIGFHKKMMKDRGSVTIQKLLTSEDLKPPPLSGTKPPDVPKPTNPEKPTLTAEQVALLDSLEATSKEWQGEELVLNYTLYNSRDAGDFKTMNQPDFIGQGGVNASIGSGLHMRTGTGANKWGLVTLNVKWKAPYQIDMEYEMGRMPLSSRFGPVIGSTFAGRKSKGYMINYGVQVEYFKGGKYGIKKRYRGRAPNQAVQAGNRLRLRIEVDADGKMTSSTGDRKAVTYTLKKPDGHIGFLIWNAAVSIEKLTIRGHVDEEWLADRGKSR